MNEEITKMQEDETIHPEQGELKAHYDLDYRKAKPNRFASRIQQESIMVVLDPDVAAIFPTSEEVNATLRAMAAALKNLPAKKSKRQTKLQATV